MEDNSMQGSAADLNDFCKLIHQKNKELLIEKIDQYQINLNLPSSPFQLNSLKSTQGSGAIFSFKKARRRSSYLRRLKIAFSTGRELRKQSISSLENFDL